MVQKGKGLLRNPRLNPPPVRKMLLVMGDAPITSITLVRTPLALSSRIALHISTFGQANAAMKKLGIDKLFHLSMVLHTQAGDFVLDKQHVIKLIPMPVNYIDDPEAETLEVPVNKEITTNQLLLNTQARMGTKYGSYSASDNNCSIFLLNVLEANGLSTAESTIFITQQADELFQMFPSLLNTVAKSVTDIAAVGDKIIFGEGKRSISYIQY